MKKSTVAQTIDPFEVVDEVIRTLAEGGGRRYHPDSGIVDTLDGPFDRGWCYSLVPGASPGS